MIGRCQEISKSSSTKSLNIHLLLLLSNTPYRRLFVERRCQSRLTPTDCNLYVSHLKNTHIRRCQLPAQCCHACVSITAPPSLLTIKPSAVLQLQPFACQSVTKLSRTRLRQHQALALEVFFTRHLNDLKLLQPSHGTCRTVLQGEREACCHSDEGNILSFTGAAALK